MNGPVIVATGSCLVPAAHLLVAPRRRAWSAAVLWLLWPVVVFVAWVWWESVTLSPGSADLGSAMLGFSLLSAFLLIPWLVVSAVVLGLVFLLRRGYRASSPATVQTQPAATAVADSVIADRRDSPAAPEPADGPGSSSPDGSVLVEFEPVEWYNNLWLSPPRITDGRTGEIILDLSGQDWDARVEYPANRRAVVQGWRYSGAGVTFEIDLDSRTYRILEVRYVGGPLPAAPLGQIAQGVEEASERSLAAAPARPPNQIRPPPVSLLHVLLVIAGLLGLAGAIALLASNTKEDRARTPIIAVPPGGFRPTGP